MVREYSVFSNVLLFIGRIFISQLFIIAGFSKILNFASTVTMMSGMGVPLAEFALVIAIIFELGGGLLLLFGYYTRLSSVLLFIFVISVTYYFHSYWLYQGMHYVQNMQHFMKNLTILGALLYVFASGAGHISLDHVFRKR